MASPLTGDTRITPAAGQRVRDVFQNEFVLDEEIGAGSQGSVWSLAGGRAAAKFLSPTRSVSPDELVARLRRISHLDLDGIPLATPKAALEGPPGYIMELLADMTALSSLLRFPKDAASSASWYRDTGGLRRRLLVLTNVADALHRLHTRALAYCDLSPANVLIPRSATYDHIWLIDPDNLSVESDRTAHGIYSPGFGAPEVVRGEQANDTLSDLFSLALLIFRVLVNVHPFYGRPVQYDPGLEGKAYSGGLPWIDHPTDDGNRSATGFPRDLVLTDALRKLAHRAFEVGLDDPDQRPTAAEWRDQLLRAADVTYTCADCGGTTWAWCPECPWCRPGRPNRPPLKFVQVMAHMPHRDAAPDPVSGLIPLAHTIVLTRGRPFIVDARRALPVLGHRPDTSPTRPDEPVAELTWHGGEEIDVRRTGHHPVILVDRAHSRSLAMGRSERKQLPRDRAGLWDVHFGPPDQLHHVLGISRDPRQAR